jgi:hypothetical protein
MPGAIAQKLAHGQRGEIASSHLSSPKATQQLGLALMLIVGQSACVRNSAVPV